MPPVRRGSEEVEYLGERPVKRPRLSCSVTTANLPLPPARSSQELDADLQMLSDAQAKAILVQYAPDIPVLDWLVKEVCSRYRQRETRLIRSYEKQVREAETLTSSRLCSDNTWDAHRILDEAQTGLESILSQMADEIKPYSSYQSKFNAAESMLQIFEAVMDNRSEECLGLIWCSQNWDVIFCDLINCFNYDELTILASEPVDPDSGGFWLQRLRNFCEEARRHDGFVPRVGDACAEIYETLYGVDSDAEPSEEEDVLDEEEFPEEDELPEEDEGLEEEEDLEEDEGDEYSDEEA